MLFLYMICSISSDWSRWRLKIGGKWQDLRRDIFEFWKMLNLKPGSLNFFEIWSHAQTGHSNQLCSILQHNGVQSIYMFLFHKGTYFIDVNPRQGGRGSPKVDKSWQGGRGGSPKVDINYGVFLDKLFPS